MLGERGLWQMLQEDARANGAGPGAIGFIVGWLRLPALGLLTRIRVAQRLRRLGIGGKLLAALLRRGAVRRYGCYFAMSARLGAGLSLPHPVGIVIGEGVAIGAGCTLYQHVTLGLKNGGYPTLGKGVVIYANAVVVGPVHIGEGATVGALSFVASNVDAHRVAVGSPARQLPTIALPEPPVLAH